MMTRKISGMILLGSILLSAAAGRPSGEEPMVLKDSEHKRMGKEVAAYWDALQAKKGISKAFDKLGGTMEKSQKKLKEMDLLAAVADWEQVFRYAAVEGVNSKAKKGRVEASEMDTPEGKIPYTYHLPKSYNPKRGIFPMIVLVHDQNSEPAKYLEENWAEPSIRDSVILVAVHMDLPPEQWSRQEGVFRVMFTIGTALTDFAVDVNRVYLAGTGQGFGAVAATADAFPQRFAGLIGIGGIPEVYPRNFRNLPTLIVGESEGATGLSGQLTNLGFDNCKALPEGGPAEILAWTQETRRDSYPAHLTFSPSYLFARSANWIAVEGFDIEQSPRIDAIADRSSNTITVDATNVTTIQIRFNDVLVDMDKPVKVVVNGTPHEDVVLRNKRLMIDGVFAEGDWGRVFTNTASYDVSAN